MCSKRELFTAAMHSSDCFTVTNPRTQQNVSFRLIPKAGDRSLGNFLVNNVDGFQADWITFVQQRVHIEFERADMAKDTAKVKAMLDDKNRRMVDFLEFYIAHAQIWFHTFCAAEGCTKPAKYTCGRCKNARYCSKECQVSDWKLSHKLSCDKSGGSVE